MGAVVNQVDKPFNLKTYLVANPGVTDLDLIRVKMTEAFTGNVELAVNLNGPVRHIHRIDIDSTIGDGMHIGAACKDLTVDWLHVYVHDLAASRLHWDAIQVLGGYRIRFRGGMIVQTSHEDVEGRCVFMSGGHDATDNPDVQDVVFENVVMMSHREPVSTKSQVFTQAVSLRSGLRNCHVGQGNGGGKPILQKSGAIAPVNEGNVVIPL